MVDASRIHPGSYISFFRSVPAWKVLHLVCVSRASSWSLGGRWRFLRGVLVIFEMVDASRIHQGSYIYIFKVVVQKKHFGSEIFLVMEPKRMLEIPERSLGGF